MSTRQTNRIPRQKDTGPEVQINRGKIVAELRRHKPVLAVRYGVVDLALFGSVARDEAGPGSDIDVLIIFKRPLSSKRYFGALHYLEDAFTCPVHCVTDNELRPELRPSIESEAIHV